MSTARHALELARDIAYGVGDDRDGWYGAAEARALADEVLRLRTLLRMGAVGGETEEIRAWCRLALEVSGESSDGVVPVEKQPPAGGVST